MSYNTTYLDEYIAFGIFFVLPVLIFGVAKIVSMIKEKHRNDYK